MHIFLNFIFKMAYNINGSNILLNCSFAEGKIALKMTIDDFSRFIGNLTLLNTKPLVQSGVFKPGRLKQVNFLLPCDKWTIILLAKYLLHHFHTIIYHNMVKRL